MDLCGRLERDLYTRTDQMGVEIRERAKWDLREGMVSDQAFSKTTNQYNVVECTSTVLSPVSLPCAIRCLVVQYQRSH
jgi:hypothetical protein